MQASDRHLERALAEYNDKVGRLEENGTKEELLEAYVGRGCVLAMMDSWVSAIEDLDDAADIITELEKGGVSIDAGLYVKTFLTRGLLQGQKDDTAMAEDLAAVARKLPEVNERSRYFDRKTLAGDCIDCAENLIDMNMQDLSKAFTDKAMSLTVGREDAWSKETYCAACAVAGHALADKGRFSDAVRMFENSIRAGESLARGDDLRNPDYLVFSYASMADAEKSLGNLDGYFGSAEKALELMERLFREQKFDDPGLISDLHGELAKTYMENGNIDKAEAHLMKQVALNLNGAKEYMDDNGLGPSGED